MRIALLAKIKLLKRFMFVGLTFLILQPIYGYCGPIKWHPGHYVAIYPNQSNNYVSQVANEMANYGNFKGVWKQYFWNKLEPQQNVYDFAEIKKDLDTLAKAKKQLVIRIQAESFTSNEKLVPPYLLTTEYEDGVYPIDTGKGYNVAYYNEKVQNRLIALVNALGKEFDSNPNVEAISLEETSTSRKDNAWNNKYFNKYIDGLMKVSLATKQAFPNTVVIQYVNYPTTILPTFVRAMKSAAIGIGGPDVFQDHAGLNSTSYQYIFGSSNSIPIGMSVDYSNYESSDGGNNKNKPSIQSIHQFAINKLKPNYIFWLRRTAEPWNKTNYWGDVINYFKSYNWKTNPDGQINTVCPTSFGTCTTK